MAVPEVKVFLLPTLERYADGNEHELGDMLALLGDGYWVEHGAIPYGVGLLRPGAEIRRCTQAFGAAYGPGCRADRW